MSSSMMIQHPAAPIRPRTASGSRSCARVALLAILVLASAATAARVNAQPHETPASAAAAQPEQAAPAGKDHAEAGAEEHGSVLQTVAKLLNFVILVGVLVYYLKTPAAAYLASRSTQIRQDLITAAETRATASAELAEIARRLEALPAELDALKARGAEDVKAEKVRIAQAAAVERERLLQQTRREIDMRLRLARRQLVDLAADLTVNVARARVLRSITAEDQMRLVDRYTTQLGQGPDAAGPVSGMRNKEAR
jgi:F-type H+-transporting ATPase subunit b